MTALYWICWCEGMDTHDDGDYDHLTKLTFPEVFLRDMLVQVHFWSCKKSVSVWNLKRLLRFGSWTWCWRQNFCCNFRSLLVFPPTPHRTVVFQAWSDIPFIDPCQASLAEVSFGESSRYRHDGRTWWRHHRCGLTKIGCCLSQRQGAYASDRQGLGLRS